MPNTSLILPGPVYDASGNSTFAGGITIPATAAVTWTGRSVLSSPADGKILITANAGAGTGAAYLQFGNTSSAAPMLKRAASSTTLAVRLADDSADAPVSASNATLSGNLVMSAAAPTVNATAATTYLQTYQNNGSTATQMDKGGYLVPSIIDPSTWYKEFDWDISGVYGTNGQAQTAIGNNSVTAALMTASNLGVAYVNTNSTTQGGWVHSGSIGIVKSASISYTWRIIFRLPVAATASNNYDFYIGACVSTAGATNTYPGPASGPFIWYDRSTQSGNWQIASAVAGARITQNSSPATAPSFNAWSTLIITLVNGVYTYTVNGTVIGTLTDTNLSTSPADTQVASLGEIVIVPDGTNFTTLEYVLIDRSDVWVTGLSR